jgi:hypothetical protein
MSEQGFYIASLKHTGREHEHITWWGLAHRGYTPVVGERCGRYTLDEARALNDGYDTIAVPADLVATLLSPEPYFVAYTGVAAKFYDQSGPVVRNTLENWRAIVAGALPGLVMRTKPEVFRRKPRSFSLALLGSAA